MKLSLLGPVEMTSGAEPVPLGGVKPRALLAALALERGRVVPADRLISVVWGENSPSTARAVLQTYVATLRRAVEAAGLPQVIVSDRQGYRAELPDSAVDAVVFEELVARGRQAVQCSVGSTPRHGRVSEQASRCGVDRHSAGSASRSCAPRPSGWTSCG
jgi:DNA-binding SARP family transcriptional activator